MQHQRGCAFTLVPSCNPLDDSALSLLGPATMLTANIPDGKSFHGVPRYYRNALLALDRAVAAWKEAGDLDFAIHFGDILDGFQPKVGFRAW